MYDKLTKSIVTLVIEAPFYGHYLSAVIREISPLVRTVGLGTADHRVFCLYVNAAYWQEIADEPALQAGTLKHEALHLVLGHLFRPAAYFDPFLYHIAADLVVNQLIETDQLPADAIVLHCFPDLKLKQGAPPGYYYDRLHRLWSRYLRDPASVSEKQSAKQLAIWSAKGNWQLEKHRLWETAIGRLSSTQKRVLETQAQQLLMTTVQRAGEQSLFSLPLSLQLVLKDLLQAEPGNLSWQRLLQLFANSARHTQLKNTIRRPSRRYGTTPGIQIKNRQHLLIAIDTSGSIGPDDLQAFFGEIYRLWRRGVQLTVVECDDAIRRTYPFRGRFPQLVSGRGATAFEAPIALANEQLPVDGIVYFTDGYGPAPNIASRRPILWVISSDGIDPAEEGFKALPGSVMRMY